MWYRFYIFNNLLAMSKEEKILIVFIFQKGGNFFEKLKRVVFG